MKTGKSESVLHDWVHTLPFMQQALLTTAMRGADGVSKYHSSKYIVYYLRGVVLKPAAEIKGNEDTFMWIDYDDFASNARTFFGDTDAVPMHFLMHLIHAAEVVGYKHPDEQIAHHWLYFYSYACKAFHMHPETEEELDKRLNI